MTRVDDDWRTLGRALREQSRELAERTVTRIAALDPTSGIDLAPLVDDVIAQTHHLTDGPVDDPDCPITEAGARHARQSVTRWVRTGVPVEELLRGLRIALEEGVSLCDEMVTELGLGPQVRHLMTRRILAWSDLAMATAVESFHAAPVPPRLQRFAGPLSSLRRGKPPDEATIAQLAAAGVDSGSTYVAVIARATGGASTGLADLAAVRGGVVAYVDGDYLALLPEPPSALPGGVAGVGPRVKPADAPASFRLAERALRTAVALGLGGARSFDDLGMLPAIVDDDAVSDVLHRRYIAPLLHAASGADLLDTVDALLTESSRGQAAARLRIHENTLRYRLGRFEELTGADLRRGDDRAEIWWALRRWRPQVTSGPASRSNLR